MRRYPIISNYGVASDTAGLLDDGAKTRQYFGELEQIVARTKRVSAARLTYNIGMIVLLQIILLGMVQSGGPPVLWLEVR